MPHEHFNLEAYHEAQALDYFFFMDDDTSPFMTPSSYITEGVADGMERTHSGEADTPSVRSSAASQ